MSKTYSDLFSEVSRTVRTMPLGLLKQRLEEPIELRRFTLLDVRDQDEFRGGHIPGALHVPRGHLEMQIEQRVPDKRGEVLVYCARGIRSAFAAKTMSELGYENVVSVNPGFERWRELGYPIERSSELTQAQLARYSRHLLLPEVGEIGQAKLLRARVLLLGVGGLGSPAALYLAAAGVGTLGLVDADRVDVSNLQRQILHTTARIGSPKVESAEIAIANLNPDVAVVKIQERLVRENVDRIFAMGWDAIVDGCDNFPTRYLVNDAALFHKIPVVHGSIFRFDGQVTTFKPFDGPCYRCLYPEPPPAHLAPSCAEAGVLGILPGIVGTLQATEVLKLLLDRGDSLVGRLLTYDSMAMEFRTLKLRRDEACAVCGVAPTITAYVDYQGFCSGER